jgi:hypothetical protein
MNDAEYNAVDWSKTCWWGRRTDNPCLAPATWAGPRDTGEYCEKWRACDKHRYEGDNDERRLGRCSDGTLLERPISGDIPLEEIDD